MRELDTDGRTNAGWPEPRRRHDRRWIGLLIMTTLLLAACRGPLRDDDDGLLGKNSGPASPLPDRPVHLTPEQVRLARLQMASVQERDLPLSIEVAGRVVPRARAEVEVTSPFPGRVLHLTPSARIGRFVKKDQPLAVVEQLLTAVESVDLQVNRIQLQAAADQMEREMMQRRSEYERAERLHQAGAISLRELQRAELEFDSAQTRYRAALKTKAEYDAALTQSQETPRRIRLAAPISGTIVMADITSGQYIDSTQTLFTIVDLGSLWIEARVFETDLAPVHQTREARVTTPAYPGDVFSAELVTIGDVVDPATRTVTVIFAVENPERRLKLGMSVDVRLLTGRQARSLVIPASAVLEEGDGRSLVYVQERPGIFQPRPITVADRRDGNVAVAEGLRAGELVVTAGAQQLRNEALKAQIPIEEEGR